jgi:TRAP-type mannitol/chloroaromatic compound transport system permease small subunit
VSIFGMWGGTAMKKFVRAVDKFNEFFGKWIALLILPLTGVVVYEVLMRRAFHAPTTWAFEMTVYLYGAHFMLGAAYTHLHDRHVRIDIIVQQLPPKVGVFLNVFTFWIIFLPFVGCLSYAAVVYAAHSWSVWEHSWTAWKPPLYPYKTIMPVALIMLLIQGIANFIRDVYRLKGEEI